MRRRAFLRASTVVSVVGLAGCLADTEYTVSDVRVGDSRPRGPLELAVSVTNSGATVEGPAKLDFTLRNRSRNPVRVRSTDVWPFGVLSLTTAARVASSTRTTGMGGAPEITLYSPRYAASGHVTVSANHNSMSADTTRVTRRLAPGDTATTTYELYGDEVFDTGTYHVTEWTGTETVRYSTGGSWSRFPLDVTLAIERRSRLPV